MNIGLICDNRTWARGDRPFHAVRDGLARLGHRVSVVCPVDARPPWPDPPDAAFVWNGVHGELGRLRNRLLGLGMTVFVMERGWFDRFAHTQIDHAGFNHTASWARVGWDKRPPAAPERFRHAWGRPPAPFHRRDGYCLVLLQVPGDAQLAGADVRRPGPLVELVEAHAPSAVEIRVRAHPLHPWSCGLGRRARMADAPLAEAVAGAKFCVTINSNAGNEALAWGCPVLCVGPALYAAAGVAPRSSPADMPAALARMAAGWRPADESVRIYLHRLACRQWSAEELAEGAPLRKVLAEAGLV